MQHNLCAIMDTAVPWTLSHWKRHLPRISLWINGIMQRRNKLHCRVRKSQDVGHWDYFRQCRNKVAKMVHRAHYNYINQTIGDRLTEQPKSFRSYVKLMRTENIGIPTLRTQTRLCTTDKENADTFSEQFLSVFTHERNANVPAKGQSPFPVIPDLNISTAGVEKQLLSSTPTKACGPDELPPRLLRTVAQELAPA